MLFFDLFMQGFLQGGNYALIAIGLTLVYGLFRILHVVHAGLYTLRSYIFVNVKLVRCFWPQFLLQVFLFLPDTASSALPGGPS